MRSVFFDVSIYIDMNHEDFIRHTAITVGVAVLTTILTGAGFLAWAKHNPSFFVQLLTPNTRTNENTTSTAFLYPSESIVVGTVKKANPAVVAITVSKNVPVYERYLERIPSPFGGFFGDDFFSDFTIPQLRQKGTELREVGGGSGFLVSADGYIVTNRHVVSDENAEYTVFTNDGKKYEAKVIARDPVLDLAVIKISGSGFEYLSFGDSDKLEIGQTVIAIGNALAEFRNTVSVGVVSGLSRSITAFDRVGGYEALDQLIQTDAGINPGNSGGPLINLSGEVVGVNVAVADGAENIGFALSANSVKSIVESVKSTGKIVRPYLGVRYIEINEEIKEKNKLSVDYGVLVQRGVETSDFAVIPGSPADKAGIVENDIILEVDGIKLTSDQSLAAVIRKKKVGDVVTLKINHKGQEKTVTVKLEEMK
jgi:S1-C subfamily serine protease